MKVVTVVGARPQFIKAAVVSRELRKNHTEVLIHTGQHYDYNMSDRFFEELDIPRPDYNLGIAGGSHGEMTGKMLMASEKVLKEERPDWVLVYGDTNSTLAAALAAANLHIPICHVEAGARTYSPTNPEEINRVCTDHISLLLLTSTESGMDNLAKEGLSERGRMVGDPMFDAFLKYRESRSLGEVKLKTLDDTVCAVPPDFYYLTCHREENTGERQLLEIFKAMHLRKAHDFHKILLTEPVGYLESICLVNHAKKIVTDSGGLQREAFFAGKKCVTILDFVCWPETMTEGRNELSGADAGEILDRLSHEQAVDAAYQPFGDGRAAARIVRAMESKNAQI